MRVLTGLSALLVVVALVTAPAAGSWEDWNCNLQCYWGSDGGTPKDIGDYFGVQPGATDGYDLIDSKKPAEPMGPYVYAWFERPAWDAGRIMSDSRAPVVDGTTKNWFVSSITDTWNIKTNVDKGGSGYFDPTCDLFNELEYPIAADIYVTWQFGVAESPPYPTPPDDYVFTIMYRGGISSKPAGTGGSVEPPAMSTQWDMETTDHIVIPLWNDAFGPWTPDCSSFAAPDTAKFLLWVYNPDDLNPTCTIDVDPSTPQLAPATFTFTATAIGDDEPFTFSWDFGDGVTGVVGNPVSHDYYSAGTYGVTCTVTDANGDTGECTATAVVTAAACEPPVCSFSYDPAAPDDQTTVQFTDTSSPPPPQSITAWSWTFGDGGTSNAQSPTHLFAAGEYNVCLTVTNDCDPPLSHTCCQTITVTKVCPDPTCCFNFVPAAPTTADVVKFTDCSEGPPPQTITSWSWDFGDGTGSSDQNPTHQFTDNGVYTVSLTVTNDCGESATCSDDVTVSNVAPECCISGPTSGQAGEELCWTSCSTDPDGTIASWAWDFGDGGVGSGESVCHTYTSEASYQVCLTVTDNDGDSSNCCQTVVISACPAPVCSFSYDPPAPDDQTTVQFTDTSSPPPPQSITAWSWTFGDGGTSNGQNPTHLFAAGTYEVCLTVTNDCEPPLSDTCCQTIVVEPSNIPPTCEIVYTPLAPTTDHVISFDSQASDPDGTVVSVSWDFGDGTSGSGVTTTHQYTAAGTYTVTATVVDNEGAEGTCSYPVSVAPVNQPPWCEIAFTPAAPTTDHVISFDSQASDPDGTVVSVSWDFGDGTSGSGVTTTHQYTAAGTYTVTATVVDDDGAEGTCSYPVTVAEAPVNEPPICSFAVSPPDPECGIAANFTDLSSDDGEIVAWLWDFGDGGTSTEQNPPHVFALGTYDVCLTVTDDGGLSTKCCLTVTVVDTTAPKITCPDDVTAVSDDCYPIEVDIGQATATDACDPSPTITNDAPPLFPPYTTTVTWTACDEYGNCDSCQQTITVHCAPWCDIYYTPASPTTDDDITFYSQAADEDGWIVSYDWDFGDGETATDDPATHRYAMPDGYTVSVQACDNDGLCVTCTVDVEVAKGVNIPPECGEPPITTEPDPPIANHPVTLTSNAYDPNPWGVIASYDWDFGDGTTDIGNPATHTYAAAGTYTVCVTVTDGEGGSAVCCTDVTVREVVCECDVAIYPLECVMPAAGQVEQCKKGQIAAMNLSMDDSCEVLLRVVDNCGETVFESDPVTIGPGGKVRLRFEWCYTECEKGKHWWMWQVQPTECSDVDLEDNVYYRKVNVAPGQRPDGDPLGY